MTDKNFKVGDKVTYRPDYGQDEKGIIKSFAVDPQYAFVVYHCAEEWDRYWDYTAARTRLSELYPGWPEVKE